MVNERNRNTFEWELLYGQASRHVEFFGVGVLSRFVKRFKDHYFSSGSKNWCKSKSLFNRLDRGISRSK